MEQDLVLQPNGSGHLHIVYGVKEQDLARMRQMTEQMAALDPSLAPSDVDWLTAFDSAVIRREWDKMDHDGVRLDDVVTETRDGWKYMKAKIAFESLQHLLDCGVLSDGHISLTRGPGGQFGYQQTFDIMGAAKSLPRGVDMATIQPVLTMMMRDFHARLAVQAPGNILRSNADRVEGRKAIWEYSGGQNDLMTRLQNIDIRMMFDGRGMTISDARSSGR